jgi:hypothetical protein
MWIIAIDVLYVFNAVCLFFCYHIYRINKSVFFLIFFHFYQGKRRGRKKGTKNKGSAEVIKKLGDATLLFAEEKFNEV